MTRSQRFTLVAAILGSGVAAIDSTIVNVALPAIQADLGGGLQAQQWISNAYLLTLGSLILIGGSLGDIYGVAYLESWLEQRAAWIDANVDQFGR